MSAGSLSKIESLLNDLCHKEFLATLAGIKPYSIIHAFDSYEQLELWKHAWQDGLLSNRDMIWSSLFHKKAGLILHVAHRQRIKELNFTFASDCSLHEAAYQAEWQDSHRYWGALLGFPQSEVEAYVEAYFKVDSSSRNQYYYHEGFSNHLANYFVAFHQTSPDIERFLGLCEKASRLYESRRQRGELPSEIINNWL